MMFFTEEEARARYCCGPEGAGISAALTTTGESAFGTFAATPAVGWPHHCAGSACMAWREGGNEYDHTNLYDLLHIHASPSYAEDEARLEEIGDKAITEATAGWEGYGKAKLIGRYIAYRKIKVRRGYCGLAGKPEEE